MQLLAFWTACPQHNHHHCLLHPFCPIYHQPVPTPALFNRSRLLKVLEILPDYQKPSHHTGSWSCPHFEIWTLFSEQPALAKFKSLQLVDQRVHGDQTILQSAPALFPLSSTSCRTARNSSGLQTRNSLCHRACELTCHLPPTSWSTASTSNSSKNSIFHLTTYKCENLLGCGQCFTWDQNMYQEKKNPLW